MNSGFMLVPVDGPARVVNAHPRAAIVSDALGGAIPAPIPLPNSGCIMWVRETCHDPERMDRNVLATILGVIITGGWAVPLLGPVAVTLCTVAPAPGGRVGSVRAAGMPPETLTPLSIMASDCRRALDGFDDGFVGEGLDGLWAARTRDVGDRILGLEVPPGYPYGVGVGSDDPVAVLMRKLGLGHRFAPVAVPV